MAVIPIVDLLIEANLIKDATIPGENTALRVGGTLVDMIDTLQLPYQEYTALLTQTGGDDAQTATSGLLTIGVTYEITDYQAGDDFTNVGAASNANGVVFVATGTTPSVWTNSTELSYNNGAPVANVLQNNIGNIWFTYFDTGQYNINSSSLFTLGKTIAIFNYNDDGNLDFITKYYISDVSKITILTYAAGGASNGIINFPSSIEIRVYP